MATFSGQGSGTTGASSYTLILYVNEISINPNTNTSIVQWELLLKSTNYSFAQWGIPRNVSINGQLVYSESSQISINPNSTIGLGLGTITVEHNNDGSKTIACSANLNNTGASYLPGNISIGGNVNLTKFSTAPTNANFTTITNPVKNNGIVSLKWSGATPGSGVIDGYKLQVRHYNGSVWSAYTTLTTAWVTSYNHTIKNTFPNIKAGDLLEYQLFTHNSRNQYSSGVSTGNINVINSSTCKIKINGVWKEAIHWIKINGVWKKGTKAYIKINGVWKETK